MSVATNASTRWSNLLTGITGVNNNPSTRWSALLVMDTLQGKYNAGTEGILTIAPPHGQNYNGKIDASGITTTRTQRMQDKDGTIALLDDLVLLDSVNVPFDADADTTIFTVPSGKRCVLTHAIVVAGSSAGTTLLSIGQDGTETDFVDTYNMSNLAVVNDAVIIYPVPNSTPVLIKSYPSGTVIQAQVTNNAGGATNTLYLFGFLY